MPTISLLEWQRKFGAEKACINTLTKVRWPQGFQCPACGSKKSSFITIAPVTKYLNHQSAKLPIALT